MEHGHVCLLILTGPALGATGLSVLHSASLDGKAEIVEYLLAQTSIDIDVTDPDDNTALDWLLVRVTPHRASAHARDCERLREIADDWLIDWLVDWVIVGWLCDHALDYS